MERINKLLDSLQAETNAQWKMAGQADGIIPKIIHREIARSLERIMERVES